MEKKYFIEIFMAYNQNIQKSITTAKLILNNRI